MLSAEDATCRCRISMQRSVASTSKTIMMLETTFASNAQCNRCTAHEWHSYGFQLVFALCVAWPLACGCCKPPLNRASQQLLLLSCSRRRAQPPSSASSAPRRAAAHLFAGRLKGPIASSAAHAHERAERRSNALGPSVSMNNRPRARRSDRICACQRSPARA